MKILVFGGNRFCGKLIVEQLHYDGHEVTVLNRSGNSHVDCEVIRGDRNELTDEHKFEYYDVIIDMCLYNVEQAKKIQNMKTNQYIFMSSIASKYEHFGDYGKDKNEVEEFLKKTNLPLVILRPTYMLGIDNPHDRETYYIDRILDKKQLQIDGDGSSLLSFVFVEDVANLVCKIVNSTVTNEAYNINNGEFITLNQLVSLFFNILRKETKIIFGDKGDSPFVNETMVFSNEKIAKHFDYKFKSIQDGIEEFCNWYTFK